jgi:hypothetical protein
MNTLILENLTPQPIPPPPFKIENFGSSGQRLRHEGQIPKLKNGELGNGGELSNMKMSLMILDVKVKYLCP